MGNVDNNADEFLEDFMVLYLNATPKIKAAMLAAVKVASQGGSLYDMAAAIEDDELRQSMQRIIKEAQQEAVG